MFVKVLYNPFKVPYRVFIVLGVCVFKQNHEGLKKTFVYAITLTH